MTDDLPAFRRSQRDFERWLRERVRVVQSDLNHKHERMAESAFAFMRATFFRWVELWPLHCPEVAVATTVLGVGDLHVDNFGTWRDAEGRLAWGINDFDEVSKVPYTNDLVRLAASALLAIDEQALDTSERRACEAILDGYTAGLEDLGQPIVLADRHGWLRELAKERLKEESYFWQKLNERRTAAGVPDDARSFLLAAMPAPDVEFRVVRRRGGLGSLGRERFTALAVWRGAMIAREAKALTTSAWHWRDAGVAHESVSTAYAALLQTAIRAPDPAVEVVDGWVVRRLAADCCRIDLASLAKKDTRKLLEMMGRETANVHLATRGSGARILRDMIRRPNDWLVDAARRMAGVVREEWEEALRHD
ncbi:MAG TPA: DUF2252 family protein [Gammaproteobacteria bacterium]|nr:DUF2252 family protein [Gammaproteobacteria bacterium]